MKKKKRLQIIGAVCILLGALIILLHQESMMYYVLETILKFKVSTEEAGSIGIIGGADGPTAIFITGSSNPFQIAWMIGGIMVVLGIILEVITIRKKS